jgi:hypothetical protein
MMRVWYENSEVSLRAPADSVEISGEIERIPPPGPPSRLAVTSLTDTVTQP